MKRRKEAASERNLAHDPQVTAFFQLEAGSHHSVLKWKWKNACLLTVVFFWILDTKYHAFVQAEARAALDQSQAANYGVFANFVVIGDLFSLTIVLFVLTIIARMLIFRWFCCFCLCGALCPANNGSHWVNNRLWINFDAEYCHRTRFLTIYNVCLLIINLVVNQKCQQTSPQNGHFLATFRVICHHQTTPSYFQQSCLQPPWVLKIIID